MDRRFVKSGFQLAVAIALIVFATVARAGAGSALEIEVGTAYTQGVGAAAGGTMPTLQTLAGGGGALREEVGWRIGTHVLQGVDLARVQVGADWSLSRSFAVTPIVGVSMTEFLSEKRPGEGDAMDLADRSVGAFLHAGIAGRFAI